MDYPARHHVKAATGWLELNCPGEALKELDAMPARERAHPDALDVEWKVLAGMGEWQRALTVAERLVDLLPDDVAGWIHRSYCLHELKKTREAMELLDPAYPRFPNDFIVPYNLACYACQLGDLVSAKSWLERALKRGKRKVVKRMALDDSDLAALHGEIERM
ncbi:MAG: tetratricopeptide repeat protein [Verrucomicrobiae bacterium]|jgi:tetratricopeptide (TPR) repeat protein|nr:tetratricopeptide repeat protein [Verrucomicrobiae bacterium]